MNKYISEYTQILVVGSKLNILDIEGHSIQNI